VGDKKYNILIIDDHPLISEAYKVAFNHIHDKSDTYFFKIDIANNCDVASAYIKEVLDRKKHIDVVLLDIRLPPSKTGKFLSGEDLGLEIKRFLPDAKIIVSTMFNDSYRVHSILKNINPDGFLIKNDITPKELEQAITTVLEDPPYYSKTVVKLLRKHISNEFILDEIDRRLLYELSLGTKMKDLPKIIPLSIAGIEKRKRHLKQIFNVSSADDRELLIVAKEKGFI